MSTALTDAYPVRNIDETAFTHPAAMPRTMPPTGPAGRAPGPGFADQPLAGCAVALTADRRRDDLAAMLRRRGTRVLEAPTLKLVPLEDDTELRAATTA